MQSEQPYNVVIAEVEYNGQVGKITGTAMTEHDDAIQFVVNMMSDQGITGDKVLRLYSEHRPRQDWLEFFNRNWPNAKISWSFDPGEDDQFAKHVNKLVSPKKSWWKFW
jgi:hypothetical protein